MGLINIELNFSKFVEKVYSKLSINFYDWVRKGFILSVLNVSLENTSVTFSEAQYFFIRLFSGIEGISSGKIDKV